MSRKFLMAAALAAGPLLAASAAHADLITVGLQETGVNGGAIQAQGLGGSGAIAVGPVDFGTWTVNSITADDTIASSLPELLDSTSMNVSSTTASTLTVWVTAQGLTQPTGISAPIISSLTSNTLPGGWTVTESTFYDAGNGQFTTTTPLSSNMFSAIGTDVLTSSLVDFAGPYSITEEYTITSAGNVATALSTIHTSVVPEPASLTLFGTALLGLGLFLGLRRGKQA